MYRLYDDVGVMCEGSFQKCISFMLDWVETDEAKEVYTKSELKEIFDHFDCATTTTSFYGFNIEVDKVAS